MNRLFTSRGLHTVSCNDLDVKKITANNCLENYVLKCYSEGKKARFLPLGVNVDISYVEYSITLGAEEDLPDGFGDAFRGFKFTYKSGDENTLFTLSDDAADNSNILTCIDPGRYMILLKIVADSTRLNYVNNMANSQVIIEFSQDDQNIEAFGHYMQPLNYDISNPGIAKMFVYLINNNQDIKIVINRYIDLSATSLSNIVFVKLPTIAPPLPPP